MSTSAPPSEKERKAQSKRDKAAAAANKKLLEDAQRAIASRPPKQNGRRAKGPPADRASKGFVCPFKTQIPYDIAGTAGTTAYTLSLNPGDPLVDPRLALMAAAWSFYRFRRLHVRWVPLGSAFAAANQTGEVVLGLNANWYISVSTSVAMASEKAPSRLGNAWESFGFDVPQGLLNRLRSLRSNWGSGGMDMRLTDILLEVYVSGTPNSNNIGYVEISGEVEFLENYVQNSTYAPRENRLFAVSGNGTQTLSSGVADGVIFPYANQLQNSFKTGILAVLQSAVNEVYNVAGGTYRARLKAYVTATTITSFNSQIVVTNAVQVLGNGAVGGGGSTWSVSSWVIEDEIVFTMGEDATGTLTTLITVVGTGTITIADAVLEISAF